MRIVVAHGTHVGLTRHHNEDSHFVGEQEPIFCVADGMGGHNAGEVASRIAVETIHEFFAATLDDEDATWPFRMDKKRNYDENRLISAIKLANLRILENAQKDEKMNRMGTTIVSLLFKGGDAYVAHVGDSRVYRIHDSGIEQLTEDHSLLNQYMKDNRMTQEEIDNFQYKNVIVRALGMMEGVDVDLLHLVPRDKDIFLLCSDGLSGMVPDAQMLKIFQEERDLQKVVTRLIETANQAGGVDNITVVVAQYFEA